MKKIFLFFSFALFTAALPTACDSLTSEEDSAPSLVYFPRSGEQQLTIYDGGEAHATYTVGLYKSSGTEQTARMTLAPMTAVELDDYNTASGTDYEPLPETCYVLNESEVTFGQGETNKYVDIEFDIPALKELMVTAAADYVVPLTIRDASVLINPQHNRHIIIPEVIEPIVSFRNAGFGTFDLTTQNEVPLQIDLSTTAPERIECIVEVDPLLLEAYNAASGTDIYEALPEAGYALQEGAVVIEAGTSTATLHVRIDKTQIPLANYVLPLRIKSVSKYSVSQNRAEALVYIPYATQLPKSEWRIHDFSYQETDPAAFGGNGMASMLIDGMNNTYWHTGRNTAGQNKIAYVTIDLGKETILTSIDLLGSPHNEVISGKFAISTDGSDFTDFHTFSRPQNGWKSYTFKAVKGRFLKMSLTEVWNNGTSSAGNWASMAELTAYGE